jgi:hypothetical protein
MNPSTKGVQVPLQAVVGQAATNTVTASSIGVVSK